MITEETAAQAVAVADVPQGRSADDGGALHRAYASGEGSPAQVAAFHRLASPPTDDLSRAFAAGLARQRIAALWACAAPVAVLTYAQPAEVARLVRDLLAAADRLGEGDLATPDAEVQAALADMGASGAMARLYTYARQAHHLAEAAQLERDLPASAMRDAGQP